MTLTTMTAVEKSGEDDVPADEEHNELDGTRNGGQRTLTRRTTESRSIFKFANGIHAVPSLGICRT